MQSKSNQIKKQKYKSVKGYFTIQNQHLINLNHSAFTPQFSQGHFVDY